MTQNAMEVEEFEAELTIPDSPRGVVLLINGDRGESTRRRSNAMSDYLAMRRYASCILDLSPRRGIALVSSEEKDEVTVLVDRVTAATLANR